MESSRRTGGTIEVVSTFGGAGRDYTDVQAWETAVQKNLITSNVVEVLECYDDAASFDTDCIISGRYL